MTKSSSPLRYPGGKSCLFQLMIEILRLNRQNKCQYVEPFAGGCGLALDLLFGGYVSDIHINDIDPSIWAFWTSVLTNNDKLIERIRNTPITIDEWLKQRDVYRGQNLSEPLELGFSAFYLNRTNRSGIIKGAGVIGGLTQSGKYKINCRYNANDLIGRIRRIHKYKERIHLTRIDALELIRNSSDRFSEDAFFCIDPPYFHKGPGLYTSFYRTGDHESLANVVKLMKNPWVVTYDNCDEILNLYKTHRSFSFGLQYSVQTKRIGKEVLIPAKGLILPQLLRNGLLQV